MPWCKSYMELYNELREHCERLYLDEGYSNKIPQYHAGYDSAADADEAFNPYSLFLHPFSISSLAIICLGINLRIASTDCPMLFA